MLIREREVNFFQQSLRAFNDVQREMILKRHQEEKYLCVYSEEFRIQCTHLMLSELKIATSKDSCWRKRSGIFYRQT